jgi:hypothetical protein
MLDKKIVSALDIMELLFYNDNTPFDKKGKFVNTLVVFRFAPYTCYRQMVEIVAVNKAYEFFTERSI